MQNKGGSPSTPPHAGTPMPALFLVISKIKGRTMRPEKPFPLFFNHLRSSARVAPSNAVISRARRSTKSVGYHRAPIR